MYSFDYQRPPTIEEAATALASSPDAKVLAGGQTLLPTMKQRLARPSVLIDLGGIAGLQSISRKDGMLVIGAMVTHHAVANSQEVKSAIPHLADVAENIGDPQVRNRGTIGGSLANNDPAADYPAAALALGATFKTSQRTLSAEDFFQGLFTTALKENEILTEIHFPIPKRFGYARFSNPASRFALAGVAVAETAAGVRVAVTGAGADGVFRVPAMEAALSKSFAVSAIAGIAIDVKLLGSDIHAGADYRAQLIKVMARDAVTMAAS